MKKTAIIFTSILLLFSGCDVFKQIGGAYQLSQCEYTYHSVDDIRLPESISAMGLDYRCQI